MDFRGRPPAGGLDFEDQFRRMVLKNEPSSPQNAGSPLQPNVRLPPPGPPHYPQQYQQQQGLAAPQSPSYNTSRQYGHPRVPYPSQGSNVPPEQLQGQPRPFPPPKQSQKQRRMQQTQHSNGRGTPSLQYAPQPPPQTLQPQIDPNAFQRRGQVAGYYQQPQQAQRQLFNPRAMQGPQHPMQPSQLQQHHAQGQYLDQIASIEVPSVTMSQAERDEKEAFRASLGKIIDEVCEADPARLPKVSLECFGSFKSGFANAGSDMDLVIVLQDGTPCTAGIGLMEDDLPRALEKRLLQVGLGARLLTRTRVPIIKICEKPNDCLLDKLRQERERWDGLPNETKYPHLHQDDDEGDTVESADAPTTNAKSEPAATSPTAVPVADVAPKVAPENVLPTEELSTKFEAAEEQMAPIQNSTDAQKSTLEPTQQANGNNNPAARQRREQKNWTRERKAGPLDFPKSGIGIQSDINFFNPLGLHNTQMLRCYSLCDPRVQPMVLFVKSWAKQRKINSSYSGTLSSYGYVLMVLHYLVNVARPPVLPNLQSPWRPVGQYTSSDASRTECDGWVVDFWRNEEEITHAVRNGQMSSNNEPIGALLAGFFNYFSSQGYGPQFHWMQEVLSLRSPGGILTKEEKGWVKAVTEEGEGRKVQHRYLFCIEDPFELSHNVARTVTHMGIVAIRDEFRRARRILLAVGYGQTPRDGSLFDALVEEEQPETSDVVSNTDGTADATHGKQPNITDKLDAPKTSNPARQQNQPQQSTGPKASVPASRTMTKALDVADQGAFPSLGMSKPKKARSTWANDDDGRVNMSEISGDRAKAYLDEVKRKKAEADAELTATGAAKAVLGDD